MKILYNIDDIQKAIDQTIENDETFVRDDRLISLPYVSLEAKPTIANEDQSRLSCWYSNQLSSLSCESRSYYYVGGYDDDGKPVIKYSSSGCFNPLTRINRYLLCVRRNFTNAEKLLERYMTQNKASFTLSSALDDVNSTNIIFSLTDFNNNANNTFNLLSAFFRTTTTNVLTQHETQQGKYYDTSDITFSSTRQKFIRGLLNGQNCSDTQYESGTETESEIIESDYLIKNECKSKNYGSYVTIECSDILYLLNMFIQNLKNTKYVFMTWTHKYSNTSTSIRAKANLTVKEFEKADQWTAVSEQYSAFSKVGNNISLVISPWLKQNSSESNKLILYTYNPNDEKSKGQIPVPQNYQYIYDMDDDGNKIYYRGIVLDNLVYDQSSGANLLQNIPRVISGTNGIFGHELTVKKNDNFKLTISDIQNMYKIFPNAIITRKAVLNAIDYIFRYWLEHMSTISYVITTCHCNCHDNTAYEDYEITVKRYASGFVTFDHALRHTDGCYCGDYDSFTYQPWKDIPKKYHSNGRITGIYASFEKTGYTENTNALETFSVSIGGKTDSSTLLDAFSSYTNFPFTKLKIEQPISGETITVNADYDTNLKKKKQFFCLHVYLKVYYYYEKPEDEKPKS